MNAVIELTMHGLQARETAQFVLVPIADAMRLFLRRCCLQHYLLDLASSNSREVA